MKYNDLDYDLPNHLAKNSDDELAQAIYENNDVQNCLQELAEIYYHMEEDMCVIMPFARGTEVTLILEGETTTVRVLGYEYSVRPDGTKTDLIMVGIFEDDTMTILDKVLAFDLHELVENMRYSFDGVPIAPDTVVLAFGGQMNKKNTEI